MKRHEAAKNYVECGLCGERMRDECTLISCGQCERVMCRACLRDASECALCRALEDKGERSSIAVDAIVCVACSKSCDKCDNLWEITGFTTAEPPPFHSLGCLGIHMKTCQNPPRSQTHANEMSIKATDLTKSKFEVERDIARREIDARDAEDKMRLEPPSE